MKKPTAEKQKAIIENDKSYDGQFFYAVIYLLWKNKS